MHYCFIVKLFLALTTVTAAVRIAARQFIRLPEKYSGPKVNAMPNFKSHSACTGTVYVTSGLQSCVIKQTTV